MKWFEILSIVMNSVFGILTVLGIYLYFKDIKKKAFKNWINKRHREVFGEDFDQKNKVDSDIIFFRSLKSVANYQKLKNIMYSCSPQIIKHEGRKYYSLVKNKNGEEKTIFSSIEFDTQKYLKKNEKSANFIISKEYFRLCEENNYKFQKSELIWVPLLQKFSFKESTELVELKGQTVEENESTETLESKNVEKISYEINKKTKRFIKKRVKHKIKTETINLTNYDLLINLFTFKRKEINGLNFRWSWSHYLIFSKNLRNKIFAVEKPFMFSIIKKIQIKRLFKESKRYNLKIVFIPSKYIKLN